MKNTQKHPALGAPYDLSNYVRSELWPTPSVHQDYWERHNCAQVYQYDPTENGPEWFVTRVILATHTEKELWEERMELLRRQIFGGSDEISSATKG